jgi:hypothetical protein
MPVANPKKFPIRDIKSNAQAAGQVWNPPRMSEHGGLTSVSQYGKDSTFNVEPPVQGSGSGTKGAEAPY